MIRQIVAIYTFAELDLKLIQTGILAQRPRMSGDVTIASWPTLASLREGEWDSSHLTVSKLDPGITQNR